MGWNGVILSSDIYFQAMQIGLQRGILGKITKALGINRSGKGFKCMFKTKNVNLLTVA